MYIRSYNNLQGISSNIGCKWRTNMKIKFSKYPSGQPGGSQHVWQPNPMPASTYHPNTIRLGGHAPAAIHKPAAEYFTSIKKRQKP